MELYRCDITLHDYLFFATTERGKVAETGPFIHNYALTYALGWATSPWHNEIQKPHYREELALAGKRYATPARLLQGSYIVSQYNTMGESYSLGKGQSIGYPDWGFIKCFRPGSRFRFYVISAEAIQFPRYIRLGKFMAKSALSVVAAERLEVRSTPLSTQERKKPGIIHPLLTWNDLPAKARPVVYDIIVSALPGRLIEHADFQGIDGSYLIGTFSDDNTAVQLPIQMGYYGVNLCNSW